MNNINIATVTNEKISLEQAQVMVPPGKTGSAPKSSNQMQVEHLKKADAERKEDTQFSAQEAKQLAEDLNEIMDDLQTSLGFFIRDDLNHQVVVEIKDRDTNELIKQIPSEELLQIKEKMEELTGMIFDHTV